MTQIKRFLGGGIGSCRHTRKIGTEKEIEKSLEQLEPNSWSDHFSTFIYALYIVLTSSIDDKNMCNTTQRNAHVHAEEWMPFTPIPVQDCLRVSFSWYSRSETSPSRQLCVIGSRVIKKSAFKIITARLWARGSVTWSRHGRLCCCRISSLNNASGPN